MTLLTVIIYLIIIGVLLWLVNSFIPMASPIKTILNAVVVIAVIIWLLNVFGLMDQVKRAINLPVTVPHTTVSTPPTNSANPHPTALPQAGQGR